MSQLPFVKEIMERLGFKRDDALELYRAFRIWNYEPAQSPKRLEAAEEALFFANTLLGRHGIQTAGTIARYVKRANSHLNTLLYDLQNEKWYICYPQDWIEYHKAKAARKTEGE